MAFSRRHLIENHVWRESRNLPQFESLGYRSPQVFRSKLERPINTVFLYCGQKLTIHCNRLYYSFEQLVIVDYIEKVEGKKVSLKYGACYRGR